MKEIILFRDVSTDEGTFGKIVSDILNCYTLELPWRGNQPFKSSIPASTYLCRLRYSPRFKKNLYGLMCVEDRSDILIHAANFAGDIGMGYHSNLNGCIALGKSVGILVNKYGKAQRALLGSSETVTHMMRIFNGEDFLLKITEAV